MLRACHQRAEMITKDDPAFITEVFGEREIEVDGITYTIAGSFDGLYDNGETIEMYDYKTGYFKSYGEDKIKQNRLQMSIYRWINQDKWDIADRAWIIAISQSNNYIDEIPFELMSLEDTQDYIENKLYAISANTKMDCKDGVKYNTCQYCEYECEERK